MASSSVIIFATWAGELLGVVLQSIGSVDAGAWDIEFTVVACTIGIMGSLTTFVSDMREFITGPGRGWTKLSAPVTFEHTSANAWRWVGFTDDIDDAVTVVLVVVVRLMQVFTDGIMGIGIVGATHGWGFAITPQAARFLLNSGNQSFIAFFNAWRGWYMFGDRVEGTSSPTTPSSVSVSSFISDETVSSEETPTKYINLHTSETNARKLVVLHANS